MLTCGQLQRWGWGGWINPPVYHSQHVVLFTGSLWGNSNWLRSSSDSGFLLLDPKRLGTFLFPPSFSWLHFPSLSYSVFFSAHERLFKYKAQKYEVAGEQLFWPENSLKCVLVKMIVQNIQETFMILTRISKALLLTVILHIGSPRLHFSFCRLQFWLLISYTVHGSCTTDHF